MTENICTCTTPQYTITLNQQGPPGIQGEPGQDGFTPVITVNTNTDDSYTLNILTPTGMITTPNLKVALPSGGINGQVLMSAGDGITTWSSLPVATPFSTGIIKVATIDGFSPDEYGDYDNTNACTPATVVEYVNSIDTGALENIKDITNGVQIMGFEEVPPTGNFSKQYFQFTVDNSTNSFTAQQIFVDYQNSIPIGSITRNFLTDYSIATGAGITVSKENNGITIGSTTGNLKYSTLTSTEYSALTPDADTMYRLTDTNEVYLGTIKLTGGGGNVVAGMYAGTPAGGQNTGYVGTDTVTVTDVETTT